MAFLQDVIIVGAGPAGATLAYLLARSGIRVTLLEQQTVLDREFRGPAYQPSIVRIWEEMGILDEIMELDVRMFGAFSFFEGSEKRGELNLSTLPPPYNALAVMQQATLLKRLITLCGQFPNFTYLGGTSVHGLVEGGVKARIREKEEVIEARLVVGCDGRFSRVREAAGIRLEEAKQAFDIIWFEMPTFKGAEPELGFYATPDGTLLYIPKEGGLLQVGWILPKGEYKGFKSRGLDYFKRAIASVDPTFGEPLSKHLTNWDQCHLLDVKMGISKEWVRDGLLLLGDAAHVASPMGALGNKLAIEDAALAHPIILSALEAEEHLIPASVLRPFVETRLPDIRKTLRLQRVMGHIFLKMPRVRRYLLPYLMKSPMGRRIRNTIALSPRAVHVDTSRFREGIRQYHYLPVKEIRIETPHAKTFVFEIPDFLKETFAFKAGQFVTLRLLKEGRLLKRCYSLSSIPGEDLAITVKRVEEGLVSTALHDTIDVGDKLLVLPPAGEFVARRASAYTFIAGGSGITPVSSLIRSLLSEARHVTLLYVNSTPEETIFRDELNALQNSHPDRFKLTHHWTSEKERPKEEILRPYLQGPLYLCGPSGLMELAERLAGGAEVYKETYASVTGIQEARPQAAQPIEVGEGIVASPASIRVTIGDQTTQIPCREGESILDAALSAGLPAPFSCQEGICSTCKADLLEGRVRMERHDALSAQDIEEGKILTCRAKPLSEDVCVDYQRD